ncbi:MAG TPA: hypothetical protein VIM88_08570 [Sulfurovum sp.]|uniref:hypothetical protein n=1 Tax=Sulfurovum sp. TaxID=1969726 RepID=UPI002F941A9E
MLNLDTALEFLPLELAYLNSLNNPTKLQQESWSAYNNDASMKSLKKEMKIRLLLIQNDKCVYCMKNIDTRTHYDGDREHFANKDRYPQYTFEPYNLLISCSDCNRPLKGTHNTISTFNSIYSNCEFNIVHPILDNVPDHIDFTDKVLIFAKTDKGLRTIELFKLDHPYLYSERVRQSLYQERENQCNQIIDDEIIDLINFAVNYHI